MKKKSKQIKDIEPQGWLDVVTNVFLALLLVVAVALSLAVVERVLERKAAEAGQAGVPIWHAFAGIKTAEAATLKGYEALQTSISGSGSAMSPGEIKTITINFLNIGIENWSNTGSNFVSVYAYDPKYRISSFADSSWYKTDQPALISESVVSPKSTGTISFKIKAPLAIGTYKETFALAAEDKAWIPGGQFTLNIVVANPNIPTTVSSPVSTTTPTTSTPSTDGYSATILVKSAKKTIQAKGGEEISFTAGIKNSGSKTWNIRAIKLPDVMTASSVSYKDSSWVDTKTAVVKTGSPVAPGAMDLITFKFKAPSKKGSYTVKFALAADDVVVPGSEIEIPIEVTSNSPDALNSEVVEDVSSYIEEPTIRVGVLIVDEETQDEVQITCASDFAVENGDGKKLLELSSGEVVTAYYVKNKYWYEFGGDKVSTADYLRFVPEEENTVCTVTNFDRRVTRNAAYANNQFRNILELRYNSSKDRVWLINELLIEYYLRGLGETSNDSNLEFQKALLTAARTYATYHWERATKHAKEFFHVDAYADQVYYGYGHESRTPRITQAVTETRGQTVTYEGSTAITPYFSRSDGRTRDWSEVWGGSVAWCVSVETPHDVGKILWGHGVGMSASEALQMGKEGTDWQDILKYFYTGINITKRWE